MINIAILGFGTVGGGIPEVIEALGDKLSSVVGDRINVKYILDLRDFPSSPYGDRIVHSIDTILDDDDVKLVAETMGGSHPAFEMSLHALERGKHVVTSNKEVVASYGDVLLKTAAEHGVSYLFEASVGGGIPVIRPFTTSLSGEDIVAVDGILNGTTNFILSKMRTEGRDFADVLLEAQVLGYAEKDPSADVDGIDAKRKIMILSALSSGILSNAEDVYAESIRNITPADIDGAERMGGVIKLIASARIKNGVLTEYVCPQIVMKDHALSAVNDVYNAISVTASVTGDVMFYGRGAGRYPTAGAVVADIGAALSGMSTAEKAPIFTKKEGALTPFENIPFSYYIRIDGTSPSDSLEIASRLFDKARLLDGSPDGKSELICGEATLAELDQIVHSLGTVESIIRIY